MCWPEQNRQPAKEEEEPEEIAVTISSKFNSKRRPTFRPSSTTLAPPTDDPEEHLLVLVEPHFSPVVTTTLQPTAEPETAEPEIPLLEEAGDSDVQDSSVELTGNTPQVLVPSTESSVTVAADDVIVQLEPSNEASEIHFTINAVGAIDRDEQPTPKPLLERKNSFTFTMATDDPMLPIEELWNIRIRDDGKGMWSYVNA